MTNTALRRSFILFHCILGLGLLIGSAETLASAFHQLGLLGAGSGHADHQYIHVIGIAGIEALGAALFLVPRTLRLGGFLLLATILMALLIHSVRGEWRIDLVIYAAGTWFVMVHGPAWGARTSTAGR